MNVTGKTKIYRHENENGYVSYSRCIASKKYEDGHQIDEWIRTYEKVQLPKGVDVPNKSIIDVKKAFEAVTEFDGRVYRKLVIQEFMRDPNDTAGTSATTGTTGANSNDFEEIDEDVPF